MRALQFLFLSLAILLTTHLSAQQIGIEGMYGFTDGRSSDATSYKNYQSTKLGLSYIHHFNQAPVHLKTGLYYSQRGLKTGTSVLGMDLHQNIIRTKNIEVPIMAGLNYPVADQVTAYLRGGGYASATLEADSKHGTNVLGVDATVVDPLEIGNKDGQSARWDLGLQAEAGIRIKHISVGLVYQHGFMDRLNKADRSVKERVISASVGYWF